MKTAIVFVLGFLTVVMNATQFAVLLILPSATREERADYRSRLLGEFLQWIAVTGLFVASLLFVYPGEKAIRLGLMSLAGSVVLGFLWFLFIKTRISKKWNDEDSLPT